MLVTDPWFYALAVPVVLLSGVSKTGIPGLFGGMAVPVLALVMPPAQAAGIMLPLLCVMDLFGLKAFRGVYDRVNMPIIATGLLFGIVLGALTFGLVSERALRLVVGVISVAFALNNLLGWAKHRARARASWPRGVFWSGLSGYTSFLTHSGNAPLMAYLLPQRMNVQIYVGTTVWYFFISNYAKLIPYAALGQLNGSNLLTALVLMPLIPIGVKLGIVLQGKLDERLFYQVSYWALLGIGVKLVYDGLSAAG